MPRRDRCRRAFTSLLAAALMALIAAPGTAGADGGRPQVNPEERAAAMIRPAVMYLAGQAYGQVRLPSGQMLSQFGPGSTLPFVATWNCTGFVVNPDGWVATAGHCVDPQTAKDLVLKQAASTYLDQFPDSPAGQDLVATIEWLQKNARVEGDTPDRGPVISLTVLYGTGTKLAGKLLANVVDFRPLGKGDVALLKVEKHSMPSAELASDADVSIGTSILAVGFPQATERVTGPSLDPTNKSGTVSKRSTMASIPEYEIDAAITEGMSGGPTIGLNGKVVGVNSFAPAGEPQPFNFITPADGLAAILAAKSVKPMLGPADMYYRKGLDHYYSGHYSDAIKDFDQTLAMSPDYPGVADLRTSAANLRHQYGDVSVFRSSNLLWYIISGTLLVLAAGGYVIFMVLRSRRQRLTEAEAAASPVASLPTHGAHEKTGAAQPLRLIPAQRSTVTEPHFCANCGAEHHPAENFCPNCGKQISRGESAQGNSQIC
jgi:serine protease Do